jgi:hypothetical protein
MRLELGSRQRLGWAGSTRCGTIAPSAGNPADVFRNTDLQSMTQKPSGCIRSRRADQGRARSRPGRKWRQQTTARELRDRPQLAVTGRDWDRVLRGLDTLLPPGASEQLALVLDYGAVIALRYRRAGETGTPDARSDPRSAAGASPRERAMAVQSS